MNHANDMLEIVKEVNLNKLDKTLHRVMRQIQKQANKGHADVLLHRKFLGESDYLRDIVIGKLRDNGYSVDTWGYNPFIEISWR